LAGVSAVDPQREHVFRVLDAPPGSGEFQAFLRDIAMRAFDFAGADREPFGQGLAVFQLVFAAAEITMACPDRGLIVAYFGSLGVFCLTLVLLSRKMPRPFRPSFRLALTMNRRKSGKNCLEPSKKVAM
jgi:hypothetical protein